MPPDSQTQRTTPALRTASPRNVRAVSILRRQPTQPCRQPAPGMHLAACPRGAGTRHPVRREQLPHRTSRRTTSSGGPFRKAPESTAGRSRTRTHRSLRGPMARYRHGGARTPHRRPQAATPTLAGWPWHRPRQGKSVPPHCFGPGCRPREIAAKTAMQPPPSRRHTSQPPRRLTEESQAGLRRRRIEPGERAPAQRSSSEASPQQRAETSPDIPRTGGSAISQPRRRLETRETAGQAPTYRVSPR